VPWVLLLLHLRDQKFELIEPLYGQQFLHLFLLDCLLCKGVGSTEAYAEDACVCCDGRQRQCPGDTIDEQFGEGKSWDWEEVSSLCEPLEGLQSNACADSQAMALLNVLIS